ncbi:MAG: response regulator [Gemmatimonadales bacterium]|nr:response regulator [Gemmatimonadales bacterium]
MRPERQSLRILVVDDDPDYARLVTTLLEQAGHGRAPVATSIAQAMALAPEADLVLLDHQLPDGQGLAALPALRAVASRPAVVLVTAHGDEALAAAALRAGADDYLIKDPSLPALLPQVVERHRRQRALRDALAAAERDLVHAERLAAIGQLNVTLHHNINNPLMAAYAELALLIDDPSVPADHRTALLAVRAQLERIRQTLDRVGTLRHDRTTPYLDHVPMIDLSRRTQAVPSYLGEAVLHLPDQDTERVVAMLLRHAGFGVTRVTGAGELTSRASEAGVAVVLIHGSGAPGTDPLGGFHPPRERDFRVVALVQGDPAPARAAGADHVIGLPFDPGTLCAEVLATLRA